MFAFFQALSMLQSGPLPRVLSASLVEEVFNNSSPRAFVHDLRRGLDALCLYEVTLIDNQNHSSLMI
jgi:hypothetical protein